MSRPVTHTCGAFHSLKHRPHCTPDYRREEGCWCFLFGDRLTARKWRTERRKVKRDRRSAWYLGTPVPRPVVSWAGLR